MLERFDGVTLTGGYELKHKIGGGNYGDVYLGHDPHDRSLVAVKLFDPSKTEPSDVEHEARMQARLHHPNIIPFHWYDTHTKRLQIPRPDEEHGGYIREAEFPFIVMMYANRGSLKDYVRANGTPSPDKAVELLLPAIAGVQAAHDKKVLHRDLKTANIVLNQGEQGHLDVLVSDFGIAVKAHTGDYDFTKQDPKGSIKYVAPEQMSGKAVYASDQYALGVIAYELLTGKLPFVAEDNPGYIKAHMFDTPPSFSQVREGPMNDVLAGLEEVVMRTLAKDPIQRYASVGDFGEAVAVAVGKGQKKEAKAAEIIDLGKRERELATRETALTDREADLAERTLAANEREALLTARERQIEQRKTESPASTVDKIDPQERERWERVLLGKQLKDGYQLKQLVGATYSGPMFLGKDSQENPVLVKFWGNKGSDERRAEFNLSSDKRFLSRINLTHPNILSIYQSDMEAITQDKFYTYRVMKYPDRGSLRAYLDSRQRLPIQEAVEYISQTAAGIQHLHDQDLNYDGLTLDRIFIEQGKNNLFLLLLPPEAWKSREYSTGIDWFPYIAPEGVSWNTKISTDLYSLGVIAYELLTGELPVEADRKDDPISWAIAHLRDDPRSFVEVLGNNMTAAHARVEKVVRKALEKEPADRQESVIGFARELKNAARFRI